MGTRSTWEPIHLNWDNGWLEGLKTESADMQSTHIRWDQFDPAAERSISKEWRPTEHAGEIMVRDGIRIEVSRAAPGFGRPGGASQIRLWDPKAKDLAGGWMSPDDAIDRGGVPGVSDVVKHSEFTSEFREWIESEGTTRFRTEPDGAAVIVYGSGETVYSFTRIDDGWIRVSKSDRGNEPSWMFEAATVEHAEKRLALKRGIRYRQDTRMPRL